MHLFLELFFFVTKHVGVQECASTYVETMSELVVQCKTNRVRESVGLKYLSKRRLDSIGVDMYFIFFIFFFFFSDSRGLRCRTRPERTQEGRLGAFSGLQIGKASHQVVSNRRGHDRILLIVRMRGNKVALPACERLIFT